MELLSEQLIRFYLELPFEIDLPEGVELMNPYLEKDVQRIVNEFFNTYYSDNNPRIAMFGINPGRFGAGITGITFTDPVRLEEVCGVSNNFNKRQELSSVFIYDFISSFGGAQAFFSKFLLTAVFPLGFTKNGKNLNYYDDRELLNRLDEKIAESIKIQLTIAGNPDTMICIGEGTNYKYLEGLNKRLKLVGEIIPLPHPRWVMQYRYKRKEEFIDKYIRIVNRSLEQTLFTRPG